MSHPTETQRDVSMPQFTSPTCPIPLYSILQPTTSKDGVYQTKPYPPLTLDGRALLRHLIVPSPVIQESD
jgi:hypothetical protein